MLDQKSREILYYKVPVFAADLFVHFGVLFALLKWLPDSYIHEVTEQPLVAVYGLLAVAFAVAVGFLGIKVHERGLKLYRVLWQTIWQTALTYGVYMILLVLAFKITPRYLLFWQMGITVVLIVFSHTVISKAVRKFRNLGHNTRYVLMIGGGPMAARLFDELNKGQSVTGYKVRGYFNDWESDDVTEDLPYLGKLDALEAWLDGNNVDELYCMLPPSKCQDEVNRVIKICNDRFIEFYFAPTMEGYPKRVMRIENFGSVNVIKLREEPMNTLLCKCFKRSLDVLISGLFVCTIYPFVCLFVWIGDNLFGNKGTLYFRQERTGYNGRNFIMYKFRSMRASADADTRQATKDDPRKTPFGDFLRKSSIDELPQFLNVLKGDMSIIGPRPHMMFHTEMYSNLIGDYMVRHLAKPGITGYAQVNGCRGETKTTEDMKRRVDNDIWYIEHWSPQLDIMIFLKTIWQLVPGRDKQAY